MNDRGHLSAFTLDRMLLRSLPAAQEAESRAHLESCPACRALFEEMEADHQRFEARVLPRTLPALRERTAPHSLLASLAARWRLALPVAAAATAAVVLAVFAGRTTTPGPDAYDLGIKGGPSLQVFAARGEAVFGVKESSRLRPGDRIRFVVQGGPDDAFVLVASIDGARKVSIYYPPDGAQSAPLPAGRVELPGSIELDAAPGPEHLFAFFSAKPLTAAQVHKALERWPEPFHLEARVASVSFGKELP